MKKILLTVALGIISLVSNAQVVFNVQSPASLAGNYAVTYADPAGGWGCPDLMDPLNALTGSLAFVSDGTTADSLGCNALVNGAQIAGNIAVVYRGSCQFGTKALMAQNAGAIAVVIVNNVPGAPVGMAPGNDGANVTIPVVMISQIDGDAVRASEDNGVDVVAFIGNKFGLFQNDLGFTEDRMLLANPNVNHSLLSQNASEYSFQVGAWVYNFGVLDQSNATLSAEVTFNGSTIYSQSQSIPSILSGDTLFVQLPDFNQASYPIGKYTLKYDLTYGATDEYAADNSFTSDFFISDHVFSFVNLDSLGLPKSTTGYRTSAATNKFSSCIHFRDANASRTKATGLYFSASTNTSGTLIGQEIIATAYQWDDVFTDLNDPNAVITQIPEVGTGSYTYTDSIDFQTVYAPFSTAVNLLDNQRYLFCVTTFDANTYIGYGDLKYNLVLDTYLQPMFPIETDSGFDPVGFGGEASSIGVRMLDVNNNAVAEKTVSSVSIYPNPSNGLVHIKGDNLTQYETVQLKDQLGRTVASWKVNSNMTIDVSKFATGNYTLILSGDAGVSVNKIQINN